ncbi:IclR family transcriptional regulator [Rhodococcus sp. IEGM 1408]|uniref:IclR family transcriptional regulator n=1 Tax=Rhodococcus sp. IEGM 1408 TaxID=3082220 RepID=UPI00295385F5|nr:IclR family transcriptional regulator [Rhodococcus sp. IEGM 1408]MDV8000717.1 IclR family transcriptional regulator [Rhodococcus sp. IEGM 1408]
MTAEVGESPASEPATSAEQPASSERSASPDFVQSLARGLAVITAFDADHPRQTLSEVARTTGLTRATARRFLHTLVELGYVDCAGSAFWLTPRVLDLGYSYLSAMPLADLAQPHLERLSAQLDESSSVAVLDGYDIVYVGRVQVRRIMTIGITIGTRFPAFATSMGRVLLAALPPAELDAYLTGTDLRVLTPHGIADEAELRAELAAVADRGWSLVDQELEPGLRSLAAPVRDRDGRVVAALNLSTHAARYSTEQLRDELVPVVVDAARALSVDLASVNR